MATSLPRGIQLVTWKNADGSKQLRYRIRINRKDLKVNEMFDDLDLAIEYLNQSKSKKGRKQLIEMTEKEKEEVKRIQEFLDSPPIEVLFDDHINNFLALRKDGSEVRKVNYTGEKNRLNRLKKIKVPYELEEFQKVDLGYMNSMVINPTKEFGKLKIEQVNETTIDEIIRSQLQKGLAKSTIRRELNTLSGFFNQLRFRQKKLWERIGYNPCHRINRSLLEGYYSRNEQRVSKDEQKLVLEALHKVKKKKSKEMLWIYLLMLNTGMRRAETVLLKWEQIHEHYIQLVNTKNGKPRKVLLTPQAKEIIAAIPKLDDRLFHFSIAGFTGNWHYFLSKHGLGHIKPHSLRREFISNLVEQMQSAVMVSEIVGLKDMTSLKTRYIEPVMEQKRLEQGSIQSEQDLLANVGHADLRMTKHYTVVDKLK